MNLMEEVHLTKTKDSLILHFTDEDGQTGKEVVCQKSRVFDMYDNDDDREKFWLIHSFYCGMSEGTDFCGASFLTEEEEQKFIDILNENETINIMIHWTKLSTCPKGPFLCGLEVQLLGLNREQQMERFYHKKNVLLRFYWDELK